MTCLRPFELFGSRAAVRRGLLASATTLAEAHENLHSSKGPVAQLMHAAANEIRLSANLRADGLKERIAWQSERIAAAAAAAASHGDVAASAKGHTSFKSRTQ
jgi:biopolymer transport protein ExbB